MADVTVKTNLTATTAPTVTDDSDAGYSEFSPWLDLTNDNLYWCADSTPGAAVWLRVDNRSLAQLDALGITPGSHNHDASEITSGTFADALVAQSNVTQHEAALTITESQISDLAHTPAGAPTTAKYIVQTPDGTLSAEQALSALGTGLVKNTTGTGVLSIGVAGTDYAAAIPGSASEVLVSSGAGAALARSTFTVDATGKVVAKNSSNSTTAHQIQNAAGTAITNVDTTNQRLGIGITAPLNKCHLFTSTSADGFSIDGSLFPSIVMRVSGTIKGYAPFITTTSGGFFFDSQTDDMGFRSQAARVLFGVGVSNWTMAVASSGTTVKAVSAGNVALAVKAHASQSTAVFAVQNSSGTNQVQVTKDFVILAGTTTSPSANAGPGQLGFGDTGTAPTPGNNTCVFYGDDVAGTVEGFVADEANNHTQLSSHPPDAPLEMLRGFDYVPLIHKTIRYQLGEIHWVHGEENDPVVPTGRWVIIETFADYNARTGENLEVMDAAAENAKRQTKFQAEYDRVKSEQAKWKRLPRSVRGEFPKLPTPPRMVPSP